MFSETLREKVMNLWVDDNSWIVLNFMTSLDHKFFKGWKLFETWFDPELCIVTRLWLLWALLSFPDLTFSNTPAEEKLFTTSHQRRKTSSQEPPAKRISAPRCGLHGVRCPSWNQWVIHTGWFQPVRSHLWIQKWCPFHLGFTAKQSRTYP